MLKSLNQLRSARRIAVNLKRFYFRRIWGMDIATTASFSLSAHFDKTNPKGIHIGPYSYVALQTIVLAHDMVRSLYLDTRIGRNCFIGARSLIMPGVTIGDNCIVGAGSVVTRDVPSGSLVVGNPAKVVRSGLELLPHGKLPKHATIEELPEGDQ
jgi:acetyltransferase-like isoleucine patch superfamily enzyme